MQRKGLVRHVNYLERVRDSESWIVVHNGRHPGAYRK